MKRTEQHENNRAVIERISKVDQFSIWKTPTYRLVVIKLNTEGYRTSRGNLWTRRSLYRMLQREGFRGLYGLFSAIKNKSGAAG